MTKYFLHLSRIGAAGALAVSLFMPASAFAATADLEVSGWIPYWRTDPGTTDARAHLDKFTEVNPFGYTVRSDGTLHDAMGLHKTGWQRLQKDAEREDVRFIPTIMWSDTNAIHATLSDPVRRAAHIRSIVDAVEQNGFDGIDIDYEAKKADTRDAYSAFLKELGAELKKGKSPKWLACTIEARMPLEARYSGTPPTNIEYANDLPKLNQYCDRVRVMTYDQQTADVQLNRKHAGKLYAPIADVAWVEKVMNYMDNDIDRDKLVMGIATYGYIWQAMPKVDGSGYSYIKTEAFNPQYGHDIAKEYGLTPVRGASGELSLSYVPKTNHSSLPSQKELSSYAPRNTASGLLAALGSLAYAKEERRQAPITYLTWSDAGAIEQKVALAKKLDIAGVAIFKIDGGVDPGLWNTLPDEAPRQLTAPKGRKSTAAEPPAPSSPAPSAPAAPGSYTFTTDLAYGMNSSVVLALQKRLAGMGYLTATPNGNFGPATLAAVRAWQRANGVPSTGYFGPISRAAMNGSR